VPPAGLTTRREFLERSAAAAALLAVPWAAGCAGGGDRRIVRAAIHPALGIARVGNSPDAFFFGPEAPGALPRARGGFKDGNGAVAKQAARFRVYGLDAEGRAVRELTADEADITWRVSVANTKAAWYDFGVPYDLPDAAPAGPRNPKVRQRDRLIVFPGERSVRGAGARPVSLSGGTFLGLDIDLGELVTDGDGRLVVLPGPGRAYSKGAHPLTTFSGNDGWTDDVCDGPVQATVRIDGRTIEADPAWLLVTPPNYGPGMATGLITLYDAARSMFVASGQLAAGDVSFSDDIFPIFARMTEMQWVNEGFFLSNGFGSEEDWLQPDNVARLADPGAHSFHRALFERFRNPAYLTAQPGAIPEMYGDHVDIPQENVRQWLAVTPLQYAHLGAWAAGRYVDDRDRAFGVSPDLGSLPAEEQTRSLDRGALESCLGGAFHPGIEAPWTLRIASLWERPWRLRVRSTEPTTDYGAVFTRNVVFAKDGPLQGCAPGDLTGWLGVPWHNDAASCRSGYQRRISTILPTFWPARIPNQVLREADYRIVMDRSKSLDERRAAFGRRHDWERFVARPTRPPTLKLMVTEWPKLGMVAERPGPGDPEFPSTFKVESYVGFEHEPKHEYGADLWVPQD
jgi:L-lysine epsilon oxidase-like protein